jgi:predicted RNA binding protein YcfA (HicA-like mRNA interferase family)
MSLWREVSKLVKEHQRLGWTAEYGGQHIKMRSPTGKMVTISVSPSDHRALLNIRADLRRASR